MLNYWIIFSVCIAAVASEDGCKAPAVINATSGIIQSPYYEYFPNFAYPNNAKCRWTINVPPGKITFSSAFGTEVIQVCIRDFVTIFAPSRVGNVNAFICSAGFSNAFSVIYGPFCGLQAPPSFVAGFNTLDVEFCSDYTVHGQGFQLKFEATDLPATPPETTTPSTVTTTVRATTAAYPCGGNITTDAANPEAFIESPNYPGNYPHYLRCIWTITGPPSKLLEFDGVKFHIEGGTCAYDYVEITDITTGELLGEYCGEHSPRRLRSKGNIVQILFRTDGSGSYPGFRLNIKIRYCDDGNQDACPNDPTFQTCFEPTMLCDGNEDCPGAEDEYCPSGCGVAQRQPLLSTKNNRIYGGIEAVPHSWPWHLAVIDTTTDTELNCGGAIIDHHWILTASHCCLSLSGTKPELRGYAVRVGDHDIIGDREPHALTYPVENFILSNNYPGTSWSKTNVCLMKTKLPIFFNSDVSPVCLPTGPRPQTGSRCYATGWGTHTSAISRVLQQVDVEITNSSDCRSFLENGVPMSALICAAPHPDKGANCQTDSGGPLVCQSIDDPRRWELTGVQSFNPCIQNDAETPSAFASTSFMLDWIADTVMSN